MGRDRDRRRWLNVHGETSEYHVNCVVSLASFAVVAPVVRSTFQIEAERRRAASHSDLNSERNNMPNADLNNRKLTTTSLALSGITASNTISGA